MKPAPGALPSTRLAVCLAARQAKPAAPALSDAPRRGWLDALADWAETTRPHRRLGSWTQGR